MNSRNVALVALLGALSAVLEMIPGVPMPGAPFLKFDVAEAPVLIAALISGLIRGLTSIRGLAIAIVTVKGDPLGMMYKVIATASETVALWYLRDTRLSRLRASVIRSIVMVFFDRATIPLLYGAPVGIELLAIIFVFNLIQGSINASVAIYAYNVLKEGGLLCTLGLSPCGQDTEESGF